VHTALTLHYRAVWVQCALSFTVQHINKILKLKKLQENNKNNQINNKQLYNYK